MKNLKLINLLLILSTSLFLVQCTTDPIPGEDGMDGADGASGTAECAACHNVAKAEEVHASYLFSGHYNETIAVWEDDQPPLSQYANRNSCTGCHTSDGFIDWAEKGAPLSGDRPVYAGTQTISCNTCHGKHTTFDFENDGFDYALRVLRPVTLGADESYTIDYGDERSSHTCTTCHQPRSVFPLPNADGKIVVNSRFGPHYGAQSTLLEGIQGAEVAGSLPYEEPASAAHRRGSSCTSCHMGESTGNVDGLHTKIPTETSCVTCHSNGIPSYDFLAEDIETLKNLLIAEGLLTESGSPVAGIYDLIPASALWNYRMIYYDHSNGLHNPKYARALVKNSIEALNGN
ncbi:multiheme c-type cytochrome [Lutimonas zeaxanthinifaciens]|uniref:multiheme c-type cytochrome n=1 Tax=Lutimonas zeaxanthinifaciens TaxID=3060215 RepID=UPI00265D56F3|nr:hypothetical protein [Lutimonas sp. YSD2104]WKK67272.1 hypothetical protein QZH61_06515 [Lutimonas sp. YSD2104]